MKDGTPIPVRFPSGDEKKLRIYAIEKGVSLSAAIRDLVARGLASLQPEDPPSPRRRVLSRGV